MSTTLIIAIACMILALSCYSIGVWAEKLASILKPWHLAFFWLGFIFDTAGTTLMGQIAGQFSLNLHSVLGLLAILFMLVHALWATVILLRQDEAFAAKFHRLSIGVWLIWLIPFFTGLLLAMQPSSVL